METPKNEVLKMLGNIPESSSYEDIQYHIYVLEKIKKGISDVENKNTFTEDEVQKRLSKWLKE